MPVDSGTLAGFVAASLVLIALPGPAVVFLVNRSVVQGRRTGMACMAGVECGSLVHVLAAAVGLSAVVTSCPQALSVVKWAGAGYLGYLGVQTLRSRASGTDQDAATPALSGGQAFWQGLTVEALNPKTAVFFLSFLPQFVDPARGAASAQILVLGGAFVALAAAIDTSYVTAADALGGLVAKTKAAAAGLQAASGSTYLALAVLAAGWPASHAPLADAQPPILAAYGDRALTWPRTTLQSDRADTPTGGSAAARRVHPPDTTGSHHRAGAVRDNEHQQPIVALPDPARGGHRHHTRPHLLPNQPSKPQHATDQPQHTTPSDPTDYSQPSAPSAAATPSDLPAVAAPQPSQPADTPQPSGDSPQPTGQAPAPDRPNAPTPPAPTGQTPRPHPTIAPAPPGDPTPPEAPAPATHS